MLQTLHLNKEFSLDTPCRLGFIFTSRGAKRIDFINEYDARFVVSSQFKQIADEPNNHNRHLRHVTEHGCNTAHSNIHYSSSICLDVCLM